MSRRICSDGAAGFTLIEALVALAIVAVVLASVGAVISTTVKGTRAIDQRLALTGAAEALLAELPARSLLKPGRQSGERAGYRWRIEVSPMNIDGPRDRLSDTQRDARELQRFIPLIVNLRLDAPVGPAISLTTVRLVPRAGQ